jgi:hypothetical protein
MSSLRSPRVEAVGPDATFPPSEAQALQFGLSVPSDAARVATHRALSVPRTKRESVVEPTTAEACSPGAGFTHVGAVFKH